MVCVPLKVSAPGSFMISGEHAVLQNRSALVAALDQRIFVKLIPTQDQRILISSVLGQHETTLSTLKIKAPFEYVLAAIKHRKKQLPSGFHIEIHSEFSHTLGLGSSAAVTVACVMALRQFCQLPVDKVSLYQEALAVVRMLHPMASGADVAASVYGGILWYQMDQGVKQVLEKQPPLQLLYLGYKTATHEVVASVRSGYSKQKEWYEKVFSLIEQCTLFIKEAIILEDWSQMGIWCHQHYHCQQLLRVNCTLSDKLITFCCEQPEVYGAKISGSGLGDCLLLVTNNFQKQSLYAALANIGIDEKSNIQLLSIAVEPQGAIACTVKSK